jgi:phage terminase large subunit-like protein
MADNIVARMDPAGNIKPDKSASRERIDGMLALIMGFDRATRNNPEAGRSKYEDEGLLVL